MSVAQLDSEGNLFIDSLQEEGVGFPTVSEEGVFNSPNFSELEITDGLIAYYPLEGNAKDYTAIRNDGENKGATIADGLAGRKCFSFNGEDNYISTPFLISPDTLGQTFSWSFWNNYEENSGGHGSSSSPYFYIQTDSEEEVFSVGIGDTIISVPSGVFSLGNWIHILITFDEGEVFVFVNGELVAQEDGVEFSGIGGFYSIGKIDESYFNGLSLDHRIYNRVLSPEEIIILFDLGSIEKKGWTYLLSDEFVLGDEEGILGKEVLRGDPFSLSDDFLLGDEDGIIGRDASAMGEYPTEIAMKMSEDSVYISGEFCERRN